MSEHQTFKSKWNNIASKKDEEFSIFVIPGKKPVTQRQFNLYNYYEFIHNVIKEKNYTDAVEIGCGRGTMSLYLKKYEHLNVICTDSEGNAIELAKKNFEYHEEQATFFVANAETLPLSDNSVDVSVSIGLLEHLENYNQILAEQYRILKPGGVMISLNIPKKHSIQDLNTLYRWFYRIFRPSYALKPDYYRNTDKPADYLHNAQKIGFQNAYTINVNPFPLFTPLHPMLESWITRLYRGILFFTKDISMVSF